MTDTISDQTKDIKIISFKKSANVKRFGLSKRNISQINKITSLNTDMSIKTNQTLDTINLDAVHNSSVNVKRDDPRRPNPIFCLKHYCVQSFNLEDIFKTIPIRRFVKDEKLFLEKSCYEICGDSVICPELLPLNCRKYLNNECDCIERCKDKDEIYQDFINKRNVGDGDLKF